MNEIDCTRLDQILGMVRSRRMWYLRRGAVVVSQNRDMVRMIDEWFEILIRQLLSICHVIRTSGRQYIYEAVLKLVVYGVTFLEDLGEPPEECLRSDD